jgi:hypothetical protein
VSSARQAQALAGCRSEISRAARSPLSNAPSMLLGQWLRSVPAKWSRPCGLELLRIGSLIFIFADPPSYQIGSPSPIDTFATRLSAEPLTLPGYFCLPPAQTDASDLREPIPKQRPGGLSLLTSQSALRQSMTTSRWISPTLPGVSPLIPSQKPDKPDNTDHKPDTKDGFGVGLGCQATGSICKTRHRLWLQNPHRSTACCFRCRVCRVRLKE